MLIISSGPHLHELYYFTDGNLKLQVENDIYLVHRYLFSRHSDKFIVNDLADAGYPLPNVAPHFLDGVKCVDFDRLLSCLYPRELMVEEARSSEEWTSILKLATKWEFASLRQRAIRELDSLASPVDKVLLGHEYDIPELRLPAYVDLCRSNVPLSEEDGERLGLRDVIKIYRVRQELWGKATMPVPLEDILMKVRIHFPAPVRPSPPSCPPSRSTSPPTPSVRSLSPVTPPRWPPSPRIPARSSPSATSVAGRPKEETLIVATPGVIKAPQPALPTLPVYSPPAPMLSQTVPVSAPLAYSTKLDEEAQPRIDWAEESSQAMASLTLVASTTSAIPPAAPQAAPGPSVTNGTGKKKKTPQPPPNPGKKSKKKAAAAAAIAALI